MSCNCDLKNYFKGNEATLFQDKCLEAIKVDVDNWRGLYRCTYCNTYWEETFIEDRFVGIPELKKVTAEYVKEEWRIEVLT